MVHKYCTRLAVIQRKNLQRRLLAETHIAQELHHSNVSRYIGLYRDLTPLSIRHLYLVSEYVNIGPARDHLREHPNAESAEKLVRYIIVSKRAN